MADAALASLGRTVGPLGRRVRVSSTSDRDLRRLHELAPDLALGFDPLRHLDVDPGPGKMASRYLRRTGAYGYLDDHALAADRWGAASEYLAARADVLWAQAPVSMWYIRATLLARMLEDGFDWIADLHRRRAQVTAWTLNPDRPHHLGLAAELIEHGVDRIITEDAPRLAEAAGRGGWFSELMISGQFRSAGVCGPGGMRDAKIESHRGSGADCFPPDGGVVAGRQRRAWRRLSARAPARLIDPAFLSEARDSCTGCVAFCRHRRLWQRQRL